MSEPQSPEARLIDLLNQNPEQVSTWLSKTRSEPGTVPAGFNWLGFAEATAANARRAHELESALAWAHLAIAAYEILLSGQLLAWRRATDLTAMMYLRSALIEQFGPSPDDPALDLQQLVELFERNVPLSYAEASWRAAADQKFAAENLPTLRMIKNMLGPFVGLIEHGYLQDDAQLRNWIRLRSELP